MPPPSPTPGTPQDWLPRAQAKLVLARLPLPAGGMWEDLSEAITINDPTQG